MTLFFFYIDNIIFVFKKNKANEIKEAVKLLQKKDNQGNREAEIVLKSLYDVQLFQMHYIAFAKNLYHKNMQVCLYTIKSTSCYVRKYLGADTFSRQ